MDDDEESYGDVGNRYDMSPRCLDMSLEKDADMESRIGDDVLRMTNSNHSYLSPTTQRLHRDILEVTCETMINDESVAASKKNMFSCLNWIYTYGDFLNNNNCAQIMTDLEKAIVGAKVAIQREIFVIRCGARQCGTKTRLLLPLTSFLTSFFLSGFVFVTQLLGDVTDFSN